MKERCENGKNIGYKVCAHTLELALEYGYEILEVFEVWHWSKWTDSDPDWKLKYEASGWPDTCQTPAQRDHFLTDFKANHGIELDPAALDMPNKGKRFLAKACLVNLWGRCGLKADRSSVAFANTVQAVEQVWNDPTLQITYDKIFEAGDSPIWLFTYRKKQDWIHSAPYGSLPIACLTTSYGRIRLTKWLLEIGYDRVLYSDSDSCVWIARDDDPKHMEFLRRNAGENLGQLKNETLVASRYSNFYRMLMAVLTASTWPLQGNALWTSS
ncbi:unnamed protein product, partial [Mesorhabditis spiculigera]